MVTMTYTSALRQALREEMRRDPNIFVIGEDVGQYGGVFQVTRGLIEEFGKERVIDTPISENSIMGLATGAALMGMRPVVEIMYMDFLELAIEQLVTEAARARYMSGGRLKVPMVIRTQYNLGRFAGYGPQHTQFIASWFFQAPGLFIIAPSTPSDAKGLLKSALRNDNPILFVESAALYQTKGEVPDEPDQTTPIGTAETKRIGSDLTIVAVSRTVPEALAAAEELSQSRIEAEVIDLRSLRPLDTETIISSVKKTGRLMVVADDFPIGGVGAAVTSAILKDIFYHLTSPVEIVGSPAFPAPANSYLERKYVLNKDRIVAAARSLIK